MHKPGYIGLASRGTNRKKVKRSSSHRAILCGLRQNTVLPSPVNRLHQPRLPRGIRSKNKIPLDKYQERTCYRVSSRIDMSAFLQVESSSCASGRTTLPPPSILIGLLPRRTSTAPFMFFFCSCYLFVRFRTRPAVILLALFFFFLFCLFIYFCFWTLFPLWMILTGMTVVPPLSICCPFLLSFLFLLSFFSLLFCLFFLFFARYLFSLWILSSDSSILVSIDTYCCKRRWRNLLCLSGRKRDKYGILVVLQME